MKPLPATWRSLARKGTPTAGQTPNRDARDAPPRAPEEAREIGAACPASALARIDAQVAGRARQLEVWIARRAPDWSMPSPDAELRAIFADLRPGQKTDLLFSGCVDPVARRAIAAWLGLEARLGVAGIRDHTSPVEPRYVAVRASGRPELDGVKWTPELAARWLGYRLRTRQARAALDLLSALPVDARRAVAAAYEKTDGPVDVESCRLRQELARRLSGRDRLIALAYWDNPSGRLEAHDEIALFLLRLPNHRKLIERLAALSPLEQHLVDEALRSIHGAAAPRRARGEPGGPDAVRAEIAAAKAALYPTHLGAITDSWRMRARPATRSAAKIVLEAPRDENSRPSALVTDARALHRALLGGGPRFKPHRKDALRLLESFAFRAPEGLSEIRATYDARYGEGRLAADLERLRSRRSKLWGQRLDQILAGGSARSPGVREETAARYVALTARQVIEGTVSDRDLLNTLTQLVDVTGAEGEGIVSLGAVEAHYRALIDGPSHGPSTGNLREDMRAAVRPSASSKALLDVLLAGRALHRPDAAAVKLHETLHNDDGRWWPKEVLGKARRRREVFEMLDRRELPAHEQVAHVRDTEHAYDLRYGDGASTPSRLRQDVLSALGATAAGGAPSSVARLLEQGRLAPGDRLYHALHDRQAPPGPEPPEGGSARRLVRALPRKLLGIRRPDVARAHAEYSRLELDERVTALGVYAKNRRQAQGAEPGIEVSPEHGQALLDDALACIRSHRARDLMAQIDIDLASLAAGSEDGVRKLCAKLGLRIDLQRGAALSRFLMDLFGPHGKALDDLARQLSADVESFIAHTPTDQTGAQQGLERLAEATRRLIERMDSYCDHKEQTARNARLTLAAVIAISLFGAKTFGGAAIPLAFAPLLSGTVAALLSGVRRAVLGPSYGRSDLAADLRISVAYMILAQAHPKLPISVGAARLAGRIGVGQLPARPPRVDPEVWERLPAGLSSS